MFAVVGHPLPSEEPGLLGGTTALVHCLPEVLLQTVADTR